MRTNEAALNIISTWFYSHAPAESGIYAQVRGDSGSEAFRDIYRRCVGVFFATARNANPEARLVLALNEPWDSSASAIAGEVALMLEALSVESIVLPYASEPPTTWPAAWRNQFFVLDVLRWISATADAADNILILDSDIVWSGSSRTQDLWTAIGQHGVLTYRVGYSPITPVNGLSENQMTEMVQSATSPRVAYCGGEFIGATGAAARKLSDMASGVYRERVADSDGGLKYSFEEAHVLSWAYQRLAVQIGTADRFIRRLWTQPLKPKNVQRDDLELALWHVPAEKKYGIRRIYDRLRTDWPPSSNSLSLTAQALPLSDLIGVPANRPGKWLADVTSALRGRINLGAR